MKHFLCVIGSLFYGFCYAQHISEFESLHNTPQDSDFHLALTHDFQVIIQHGDPLSDGGSLPDNCDFSGFVPRESSSKYGYLSINSESAPGGVSILDIEYDDTSGKWEILKSESVPFPLFSFPTIANCSGTVTPWNTIISCEEYTSIRLKEDPRYGYPLDINFDGYHDFGWAIEIDPATKAVINQPGGRNGPDKLWAMGNFQHENAVVHKNKRTVYQGADNTVGEGFLYKFVADVEEKLVTGDLFVYRAGINGNGEWIQLKNKTPSEQNSTIAQSLAVNATNFIGIEDVEISPVDGKIYFAVKNESKVYRLEDSDPLAGMTTSGFETYVGGQDYEILPGVIEPWGRGNDNLAFDEKGNLWVLQDGDRNYIWVVENGHTQVSPRVKIFGRTPAGSEPTGITFSPDHKFLFMSIMHPSAGNSITSQKDALGKDISFDKDAVLVIARKEYFGPNQAGRHKELVITQYYHDTDSNSKWIELKNISGEKIPHSSYFMHLYADVLLPDISNNLPSASFDIPDMEIDEVILLKNSEAPPMPISTHIANVRQFQTDVCDFDGNDVLVLTSSPGSLRYANRRDVIGELDGSNWGVNRSIIRGANSREEPEKDFNIFNWIVLNPDQEVDQADIQTNLALGTHGVGPTSWDGATWSNLWPDRTRSTILSAGKKLTEPLTSYHLTIENGATFDLSDEELGSLEIYGDLVIEGNLILGDKKSLITHKEDALISGNMTKIEHSSRRNTIYDFTYWSSPVHGNTISATFQGVRSNRIFYYDQSRSRAISPDDDDYYSAWVNASQSESMIQGLGYAAEGIDNDIHRISYIGKPNNGTISVPLKGHFDDDEPQNDFNLLGNPYPSSIDMDLFLESNKSVIDGTVYLWTHNTDANAQGDYTSSDYAAYNRTGGTQAGTGGQKPESNFGSGQGFFVRALGNGSVIFNNSMRLGNANDQFFKNNIEKRQDITRDRLWLNLTSSQGGFDQLLIGFLEEATFGMDRAFDGIKKYDSKQQISIYSLLENERLCIQGLPSFSSDMSVNLGFDTNVFPRILSIGIDKLEGKLIENDLFLYDKQLNVLHDIKQSDYVLDINAAGSYPNRFVLFFTKNALGVDEFFSKDDLLVYQSDRNIRIESESTIESLKIYDILGRLLYNEEVPKDFFDIQPDQLQLGSVYIVKAKLESGQVKTKRAIYY